MTPRLYNRHHHDFPRNAIYIGRATRQLAASKWASPFKEGKDGTRAFVIELYRLHLVTSGLIEGIGELAGKDLVCWCAPEPCHGDVLLEAAARSIGSPFRHRRDRKRHLYVPDKNNDRPGGTAA